MEPPRDPGVPEAFVTAPPSYRDRSGGLLGFGIVQIILGGLAALGIPLMLLSALLSRRVNGGLPAGSYILAVITYGLAAIGLVTLGIGSIRARRWARAVTLVTAWIWLLTGIVATIVVTGILPSTFSRAFRRAAAANPNGPAMPVGVMAVVLTIMIVMFAVFFVLLPLLFVLFYRKPDVEETVKHRDPVSRWTDRCPLPVLAASLLCAWSGLYLGLLSFSAPLIPFFGKFLTGIPGALGCLAFALLSGYLAYSLFRLYLAGWWIAVSALALQAISSALTYAHGNLLQAYSRLGWNDTQLQMMSANPMFNSHVMGLWRVASLLVGLVYLLWIRRYFADSPTENTAAPMPSTI